MRPMSLKVRVTLLTVAIIAIVIVVISAVAYHELEESLARVSDPTLRAVVTAVRSRIGEGTSWPTRTDLEAFLQQTPHANAVDLIVWSDGGANGHAIHAATSAGDARSWIGGLDQGKRPDFQKERLLTLRYGNTAYRAAWFRHHLGDNTLSGLVVTPINYAQHEMEEFLEMLVILGVSMLLAAGVLTVLSVLWAMRPIRLTATRLDGVTYRNLGPEHVADISAPVELGPFVNSVRAMLARVTEGVESQKRFVAEASHELRTPLALAKSTIQAARLKARTSEQYQQTLDELLADVDRLARLAVQLLDLARLEEADQKGFEEVALSPMLCSLADRYRKQADAIGGNVVCDVPDAPLNVKGSPTELEALFGNLIDNALKFGPMGGTVVITAVHGDGACFVTIHDEGGQIPAGEMARLFDPFFRLDSSRSRATGGSGLGLAIAKQIATRHGGDIWIASSPAEGTTVTVRLPPIYLA